MANRQNVGISDLDVLAGASIAQSDKLRLLDVSDGQEKAVTIAGLGAAVPSSGLPLDMAGLTTPVDSAALASLGEALDNYVRTTNGLLVAPNFALDAGTSPWSPVQTTTASGRLDGIPMWVLTSLPKAWDWIGDPFRIAPNKYGALRLCAERSDPETDSGFNNLYFKSDVALISHDTAQAAIDAMDALEADALFAGYFVIHAGADGYTAGFQSKITGDGLSFPITGVDTGTKTFTADDPGYPSTAGALPAGSKFTVTGSTGNNRQYTVVSATFDTDHTDFVVAEVIASAVVDGNITQAGVQSVTMVDAPLLGS